MSVCNRREQPKRFSREGIVTIVSMIAVPILFVVAVGALQPPKTPKENREYHEARQREEALWKVRQGDLGADWKACERAITSRLLAPSTSHLSNPRVTGKVGGRPIVLIDVDAQNAFGAMLRQTWACTYDALGRVEMVGETLF